MVKLYLWIRNMLEGEEGQDLAEYGLILMLISIVAITAMGLLGQQVNELFNTITRQLTVP